MQDDVASDQASQVSVCSLAGRPAGRARQCVFGEILARFAAGFFHIGYKRGGDRNDRLCKPHSNADHHAHAESAASAARCPKPLGRRH